MATRAHQQLTNALTRTYKVVTAPVVKGMLGKFGSADDEVQPAGAGESGFCIFLEDGAIGAIVTVALLAGASIIPVKVGTGGATRGLYATAVANGLTNITPGGGTVAKYIAGMFLQSGVVGDFVGLVPLSLPTTTA